MNKADSSMATDSRSQAMFMQQVTYMHLGSLVTFLVTFQVISLWLARTVELCSMTTVLLILVQHLPLTNRQTWFQSQAT